MTALRIIDVLLYNGNNVEQMGRMAAGKKIGDMFGSGTQYVCGSLDDSCTYLYVYLNPLAYGGICAADCVLMDGEGQMIYLYAIR